MTIVFCLIVLTDFPMASTNNPTFHKLCEKNETLVPEQASFSAFC